MNNSLKKGMRSVLFANIINLGFSLLTNFILPKFLPVSTYASIKTFQLYTTYCGAIHLGFIDGMYLKYGGKEFIDLNRNELKNNLVTLRVFQMIMVVLLLVLGCILNSRIFIAFAISVLPLNMISYFKSLYQAVGEFSRYGKIMNFTTMFTFLINIILLFLLNQSNYMFYLISYVVVDIIVWIILEIYLRNIIKINFRGHFAFNELITNVKMGFFLMCGNFSSIILTSMDRWFVKILMNEISFAQYSFAVSMENFINLSVSPISVTLYNYFCNNNEVSNVKRIRKYVMIFSSLIIICAYPAKYILEHYLTKYYDSYKIMFILFGAQMFYIIIKSIYVNLYKAFKMQSRYFIKLVIVILSGFTFNIIIWNMFHSIESFAYGTLLSAILWYIISQYDFPDFRCSLKEFIFPFIELATFILTGTFLNSVIGLILYVTITIIIIILFFGKDAKTLISKFQKKYCRKQ